MSWEAVTEASVGIRVVGGVVSGLETTAASVSVTKVIVLSGVGCALSPMVPS